MTRALPGLQYLDHVSGTEARPGPGPEGNPLYGSIQEEVALLAEFFTLLDVWDRGADE